MVARGIHQWFKRVTHSENNATYLFVAIAIPIGLFFMLATPLLWGGDETFHISRIYQLSLGQITADKQQPNRAEGGYGGLIPYNVYVTSLAVVHDIIVNGQDQINFGYKQVDDGHVYQTIGRLPLEGKEPKVRYGFPNTAAYSPAPYIPMTLGMYVARHAHFTIRSTVMMLRSISLFSFVAVTALALWVLRRSQAKWLIFAVALLPMTLYEGSIITADSLTNAVTFLYLALLIKCLLRDNLTRFEQVLLVVSVITLPILKPGYGPLLLPLLFIPWRSFAASRRTSWLLRLGALAVAVVLFGLWTFHTRDVTNNAALIRPDAGYVQVSSHKQLHYIVHHPLHYAVTAGRLLFLEDTKNMFEMFGSLGTNKVNIPGISLVFSFCAIMLGLLLWPALRLGKWMLASLGLSVIVTFLVIITGMYLTFTSFAAPMIMGVQGRYFIPLLLPFLIVLITLLRGWRWSEKTRVVLPGATTLLVGVTCLSLILAASKYFFVTWG